MATKKLHTKNQKCLPFRDVRMAKNECIALTINYNDEEK